MAFKSVADDLKLIRNLTQDYTDNPYSTATSHGYSSSTKYVFSLGMKKLTGTTPTDTEFYERDIRSGLPLIVSITLVQEPRAAQNLAGTEKIFGVMFRCFVSADSIWTFKSANRGAEEMAMEKLNEIAYEFLNDSTIMTALEGAGLTLGNGDIGDIRPIEDRHRQDYGYAMEAVFLRTNVS
jgi:hypothetical protein